MTYSTTRYRTNPDRHLSLRASSAVWWPCTIRYDHWALTPSTSSPYRPSTGSVTGLRRRQSWPPLERQVTWRFTNLYPAESRQNNSTPFSEFYIVIMIFTVLFSPLLLLLLFFVALGINYNNLTDLFFLFRKGSLWGSNSDASYCRECIICGNSSRFHKYTILCHYNTRKTYK